MSNGLKLPKTAEEVDQLTLGQLNAEISWCLSMSTRGGSSQGRKAFFKRLVWLEAAREKLHGVPAKRRRFGRSDSN